MVYDVGQPSDILCALWLARRNGLFAPPWRTGPACPGQVNGRAGAAVRAARGIGPCHPGHGGAVFNPAYAEQLWARGRHQELVLGYAEREDGHRASQWSLYRARDRLGRQARERGLALSLHQQRAQPRASATNAATNGDSSPVRVTASSSVSGAPVSGL